MVPVLDAGGRGVRTGQKGAQKKWQHVGRSVNKGGGNKAQRRGVRTSPEADGAGFPRKGSNIPNVGIGIVNSIPLKSKPHVV